MARKLPLSDPKSSVSHSVALPPLTAGDYVVTWRALSDDTHVSSGTLKFSVHPK
jgi:methionine-rich copper-binding protein CopC